MRPLETVELFDVFLSDRDVGFSAVIVGGSALALLGVVVRQTRDVDVIYPIIPSSVIEAAREFAAWRRSLGDELDGEWLNNGPASLVGSLPDGWKGRLVTVFEGRALTLRTLGRTDLLKTKLFALCDRGTDVRDCLALNPTTGELADAGSWVELQDGNPEWPRHVRETLRDLMARLGHGV